MFFVQARNNQIVETNVWEGHDYSNRFCFLSKAEDHWLLLIPERLNFALDEIWAGNSALIERSRHEEDCIDILFPNDSEKPFKISLDLGLVDKKIVPGDFIMTVWSRQGGLEIKLNCHIRAKGKNAAAIDNTACFA
ncbi:MAG: hypothetical protein PHX60_06610 [Giesbergeria sp.]|uniref:hypothetical protein n=1 Tax=Giesbergeria sp. TaxID=2818473 RepID=UPI00262BBCB6|nr:hypothetical protein [Giesbergeria sp.]MDD2609355.1 hypothetical protein [Giesbergeria sp.]